MELSLSLLVYVIGGMVVVGMTLLVTFQEKLIYSPEPRSYRKTPNDFGRRYEDVCLKSYDGVRLHAWFISLLPKSQGPTIIFCQQNGGNISDSLAMVHMMMKKLQCNVFMLSYRGYGDSDGLPSQQGINMDAQAALDHLVKRTDIDTSKIVVYGRSLGGAVATSLTNNNPDKVAALILENTFTSILDMAGVFFPILQWFMGSTVSKGPNFLNFLVRSPWNTVDIIGKIKKPILFISGRKDEIVPAEQMDLLYAKAAAHNQRCMFEKFDEGTHMKTWSICRDLYWDTITNFFNKNVFSNKKDN